MHKYILYHQYGLALSKITTCLIKGRIKGCSIMSPPATLRTVPSLIWDACKKGEKNLKKCSIVVRKQVKLHCNLNGE